MPLETNDLHCARSSRVYAATHHNDVCSGAESDAPDAFSRLASPILNEFRRQDIAQHRTLCCDKLGWGALHPILGAAQPSRCRR
jgi:hypothetical protein